MPAWIPFTIAVGGTLGKMIIDHLVSPPGTENTADAYLRGLKQGERKRIKEVPPPVVVKEPETVIVREVPVVSHPEQPIYTRQINIYVPILVPQVRSIPAIAARRLPNEADGQSDYDTPAGKSISIKDSIGDRVFGLLLHRPLNRNPYKFRVAKYEKFQTEFSEKNQKGLLKFAGWLAWQNATESKVTEEELDDDDSDVKRSKWDVEYKQDAEDEKFSIWDSTALIASNNLKGFTGEIGMIYGLEGLHALAKEFSLSRINAYQAVNGLIPLDYEIVEFEPEIPVTYKQAEITFDSSSNSFVPKIWEILGGRLWESEPFKKGEVMVEGWLQSAGLEQYKEKEYDKVAIKNLPDLIRHFFATNYFRSGFHRLPLSVPESLIEPKKDDNDDPLFISDNLHYQEWLIKQLDALFGQFPIEIEIEDSDLVQVGDQKLEIKLPNIAETLAEIMGLMLTIKGTGEANLNSSLRTLAETGSTRKQAIINHYLMASIQDYLGFKSQKKLLDVDFSFNPSEGSDPNKPQSISNALKSTTQKVEIEECDDESSLESQLKTLIEAANITKSVHFKKVNPYDISGLRKYFKDIVKILKEEDEKSKEELDDFIEKVEDGFINEPGMKDTINPYGRPYDRRPKIRKLGKPD